MNKMTLKTSKRIKICQIKSFIIISKLNGQVRTILIYAVINAYFYDLLYVNIKHFGFSSADSR